VTPHLECDSPPEVMAVSMYICNRLLEGCDRLPQGVEVLKVAVRLAVSLCKKTAAAAAPAPAPAAAAAVAAAAV
jgi:hypothetical protein